MDQREQINQEPLGLSDEEFVQEVVVQECPEVVILSLDMDYSTNVDTTLETEVESMSSSIVDDEIPMPEGKEALSSVTPFQPNTKISKNGNSRGKDQDKRKDLLMALKTYSKPHTCNPCGLSYTYKNVLLKHARLCHNNDDVSIVCTQKSNSDNCKDELTIFSNSKFNKVTYYFCELCKTVFDRFDFFKRHQRLHINKELEGNIEEKSYDRGLLFKSLSVPELKLNSEQHLFVTSFPGKSKCLVFDGKFEDSDEMSNHDMSQLHTDSLTECTCRYSSKLCKYDKLHKKDLIIHNSSDDNVNINDKGVSCGILNEEVASNQALINNKARHVNTIGISQKFSTIKIFDCDSCDRVFKSKSSQKRHSRFHTGERPFNCKYCDKSFVDRSTRTKHERIHTGKRPYVCAVCKKSFIQRVTLRRHIQFIHINGYNTRSDNVEEYKCILCVFFCQSPIEFFLHLLQHSDENTAKSRVRTPKIQNFVPKDGDDTRTCSAVANYSLISDSTVMNSSLAEESKKNDSLIEYDDEISVNYKDLTHIKNEPILIADEQSIQSIMIQDNMSYNSLSVAGENDKIKQKWNISSYNNDSYEDEPILKADEQSIQSIMIQDNMSYNSLFVAGENDKIKQKWNISSYNNDSYEDEPILKADEQSIQTVMIQDIMSYNSLSVAGPNESRAISYKIVDKKLEKSEQNSSKQVSYESKYSVLQSELKPKKQSFVLKDGECSRTCPTIQYFQ